MAIKLLGDATEVKKGLDHINEFYPYVSQHLNKPIMAFYQGEKNESSIEIVNVNDAWHIRFGRRCDFFRALGCVLTEGERFNLLHENAVYENAVSCWMSPVMQLILSRSLKSFLYGLRSAG